MTQAEADRLVAQMQVTNGAWVLPGGTDLSGPVWRAALDARREHLRKLVGAIGRPEAIRRSFVEGFAFLFDRRLYDPATRRWRIEEFLDRGEAEFGGYDQVVLWQNYPRLGIDQRNQFDYLRDLPGGPADVRRWADACRRRGVRLLVSYNPWDTATREPDRHLADVIELLKTSGADGMYLDTMHEVPADWLAAVGRLGRPVYFESEGHPYDRRLVPMHTAWGQGWTIHPPAQIYNTRWLWPQHKTFLTSDRHSRDHWDELRAAWFTGTGILVWENVFGNDTSWVDRDKALLRATKPLMVAFAEHFADADWQPLVASADPRLKVNRFPGPLGVLYTICPTSDEAHDGPLLPAAEGRQYIDLFRGGPLEVKAGAVRGRIGVRGIGGVLEVEKVSAKLAALLKKTCPGGLPRFREVNTDRIRPTGKVDHAIPRTNRFGGRRPAELPAGMVWVPPGEFLMRIEHPWHGANCYDHPWGKAGRRVEMAGFAIDVFPVTNAQFAAFLAATGYRPEEPKNFLKHWADGKVPAGLENHPVVYVSLADARAYAKWAGKRLPTEAEWQYAAQGGDGRRWPWGDEFSEDRVNGTGRTAPVGSFAGDASPFGVRDLCGHVWQWMEESYSDRVHRFAILKGGSFFRLPADASKWYMHAGPLEPTSHAKCPLFADSLDRFATVGFRCVAD